MDESVDKSMDKLRGNHRYKPSHCYFSRTLKHYQENARMPVCRLAICHTVLAFCSVKHCVDFLVF